MKRSHIAKRSDRLVAAGNGFFPHPAKNNKQNPGKGDYAEQVPQKHEWIQGRLIIGKQRPGYHIIHGMHENQQDKRVKKQDMKNPSDFMGLKKARLQQDIYKQTFEKKQIFQPDKNRSTALPAFPMRLAADSPATSGPIDMPNHRPIR